MSVQPTDWARVRPKSMRRWSTHSRRASSDAEATVLGPMRPTLSFAARIWERSVSGLRDSASTRARAASAASYSARQSTSAWREPSWQTLGDAADVGGGDVDDVRVLARGEQRLVEVPGP